METPPQPAAPHRPAPSPWVTVLFGITGMIWLGLAIGNLLSREHAARGYLQMLTAALFLVSSGVNWRRLQRERSGL